LRTGDRVSRSNHVGPVPIDQIDHPTLSEGADRLLTVALGQETQRRNRQIVVGVLELRPARGGE